MTNHCTTSLSPGRRRLSALSIRCWLCVLLLASARVACAQSSTINGHIVDTTGAPVQSVQVVITSDSTHESTTVKTNASGYFLLPPLPPGSYSLDATAATFASIHMKNIKLEVGSEQAIKLSLKPMVQAQDVTVEATPPELQTTTVERGNVIESQFVENTPLNIRNPLQLVNFAQGVTAVEIDIRPPEAAITAIYRDID